ncbi:DUF1841 family protein [Paucibacter sp. XJ19-41]|uniref:DUF1841 family protein n=1 Tax=Paucibacter sp. XJ19-41 TaxID=2927824 RepID=UPI0023491FB5|nr:DUF1841 family protein [Paucibacter sp. XJ19-41]MDC6170493.1 DUF1841 family protein [Paucibacter sp. XJ19-41]
MARTFYNPDETPDPGTWLAMPEVDRIRLVLNQHISARAKVPGMKLHAAMHVVVENQIASGYGPSKRAVARLQSEGLSRHDAIHAIAFVIAQFIFELNQGQTPEQQSSYQSRMAAAIEQLRAEQWLAEGEDAGNG